MIVVGSTEGAALAVGENQVSLVVGLHQLKYDVAGHRQNTLYARVFDPF